MRNNVNPSEDGHNFSMARSFAGIGRCLCEIGITKEDYEFFQGGLKNIDIAIKHYQKLPGEQGDEDIKINMERKGEYSEQMEKRLRRR